MMRRSSAPVCCGYRIPTKCFPPWKPDLYEAAARERTAIMSNGAAPAAMALDELFRRRGKIAGLSDESSAALAAVLPDDFVISNPLDLRDDATVDRYIATLNILLDSHDHDALLILHSPALLRRAKSRRPGLLPLSHSIRAAAG